MAGCRVEKALIVNKHGKPAARFSPRADVDDGRMGRIWQVGRDTRDDCPLRLVRPSSFAYACAYDAGYVRAYAYYVR